MRPSNAPTALTFIEETINASLASTFIVLRNLIQHYMTAGELNSACQAIGHLGYKRMNNRIERYKSLHLTWFRLHYTMPPIRERRVRPHYPPSLLRQRFDEELVLMPGYSLLCKEYEDDLGPQYEPEVSTTFTHLSTRLIILSLARVFASIPLNLQRPLGQLFCDRPPLKGFSRPLLSK